MWAVRLVQIAQVVLLAPIEAVGLVVLVVRMDCYLVLQIALLELVAQTSLRPELAALKVGLAENTSHSFGVVIL